MATTWLNFVLFVSNYEMTDFTNLHTIIYLISYIKHTIKLELSKSLSNTLLNRFLLAKQREKDYSRSILFYLHIKTIRFINKCVVEYAWCMLSVSLKRTLKQVKDDVIRQKRSIGYYMGMMKMAYFVLKGLNGTQPTGLDLAKRRWKFKND